jgi:hypothetical protein
MQLSILPELPGTITTFHKERRYFASLPIHIAATETGLMKVELSAIELGVQNIHAILHPGQRRQYPGSLTTLMLFILASVQESPTCFTSPMN